MSHKGSFRTFSAPQDMPKLKRFCHRRKPPILAHRFWQWIYVRFERRQLRRRVVGLDNADQSVDPLLGSKQPLLARIHAPIENCNLFGVTHQGLVA